MPVSADIYGRIEQPKGNNLLRDYANVLNIQQGQQQNELARMKMDEYRRGTDQQNTLADLWKGAIKPDGTVDRSALLSGAASRGIGTQIPGLQKQFLEQDKAGADLNKSNSETTVKNLEAATKRIEMAGQAFNYVRQNPTVENAYAVLDHLAQNGVYTPEQAAQYKAKIQAQPDQVGQMADMAFRAALSANDQLAKISTQNLGGTSQQLSTDPVSGQSKVMRSDAITQSPDNLASNAQSDKNNQRSVGASLANAAATRAMAKSTQDATLAWQTEQRALQLDKMRADKAEREQLKGAAVSNIEDSISVVQKALDHPGRTTATGLSGTVDPRNYTPGTDAKNFRVVLDQIKGKAFLQAFQNLKGGGQITEVEGKKATDAIARLDTAQSDAEFKRALEDLHGVMKQGYSRLTGQPYAVPNADAAPIGAGPKPGTVENGYRFKGGNPADAKNWEKQ